MRLLGFNPRILCRQHLLGEHNELHKFVGAINQGQNLHGFYANGMMDTNLILQRHEELVKEFERRNYQHRSPLHFENKNPQGWICIVRNEIEFCRRCKRCHENAMLLKLGRLPGFKTIRYQRS